MDTENIEAENVESEEVKLSESNIAVEATARNGIITAVSIILGFALGFIPAWSFKEGDWNKSAVFPFVGLLVGITLLTIALWKLIREPKITVGEYKSAVRLFIFGTWFLFAGVMLAIAFTFPFW